MSGQPSSLSTLANEWRCRAGELRTYGAEPAAVAWERAATELEQALLASGGVCLTLERAAEESGYSADHLRRLARTGKLAHVRDGRRLLFRAVDLPKRPARIDSPDIGSYDPAADARRVAGMRAHGG